MNMLWLAHVDLSVPQCPVLRHCLALSIGLPTWWCVWLFSFPVWPFSAMGVDLEAKALTSALMIWRNWWISRSSFSFQEVCFIELRRPYAPSFSAAVHNGTPSRSKRGRYCHRLPSLSAITARKSGSFHSNGKETPCVKSEFECVTCGEHS